MLDSLIFLARNSLDHRLDFSRLLRTAFLSLVSWISLSPDGFRSLARGVPLVRGERNFVRQKVNFSNLSADSSLRLKFDFGSWSFSLGACFDGFALSRLSWGCFAGRGRCTISVDARKLSVVARFLLFLERCSRARGGWQFHVLVERVLGHGTVSHSSIVIRLVARFLALVEQFSSSWHNS